MLEEFDKTVATIDLSNKSIISLEEISKELIKFAYLKNLILSNNNIVDISPLEELVGLKKLYLDNNNIKNISPISKLQNLDTLDLSNNEIDDLPENYFQEIKNLKYLNLTNNKLTKIPNFLLTLGMSIIWSDEEKTDIPIMGNPLDLTQDIIKNGNSAIRGYYKNKRKYVNEVKVHLIGDGSSGKTSLVDRIVDNTFVNRDQTNGIDIREKYFEDEDITLNFWDFGGQEKFSATNDIFFTKRSLCLLVVDGRKETEVEYWLNYIQNISESTPVMIVMNKIDENPNYDVNRQRLLENYSNIKSFHRVSCKDAGSTLLDFIEDMKQVAKNDIEITKDLLPKNWLKVRDKLSSLGEPTISHDRYKQICAEYGIEKKSEYDRLLNIYEDLGSVKTIKLDNRNTIVLNPKWLTEAMSFIVANNKAKFSDKDLYEILPEKYEEQKYSFIISTMLEFERCYPLGNNNYIIPDLLSDNPPKDMYNIKNRTDIPLEFRFKFKILLKSVIVKFIIENYQLIKDEYVYKRGILLKYNNGGSKALVEFNTSDNTANLLIWGSDKEAFSYKLIDSLKTFNKNGNYKILIPLYKDKNKKAKTFISYESAKGYYNKGIYRYYDGASDSYFDISKLLTGIEKEVKSKHTIFNIAFFSNFNIAFFSNIANIINSKNISSKQEN